jgi:2-keto-4-pentenoate hydratase
VIFIAEELKRRGSALKPGDRLSLGSFGRPLVPQAGQKLTARYEGLPSGPLSVSVSFR